MSGGIRDTQEQEGGDNISQDMVLVTIETNIGEVRLLRIDQTKIKILK